MIFSANVSPLGLPARVRGIHAQDRKVEGTLTLTPAFPAFRSLPDFSFYDPQKEGQKQVDDLGSVQTSTEGLAQFDLRLSRFEAATYQVHVLAKAFEPEGGRSVSAEAMPLGSAQLRAIHAPLLSAYQDLREVHRTFLATVTVATMDEEYAKVLGAMEKLSKAEAIYLSSIEAYYKEYRVVLTNEP